MKHMEISAEPKMKWKDWPEVHDDIFIILEVLVHVLAELHPNIEVPDQFHDALERIKENRYTDFESALEGIN
jgi:hypothetical protein